MDDIRVRINIDFGKGVKREYYLTKEGSNAIRDGKPIEITTCHPVFGEIFITKLGTGRSG